VIAKPEARKQSLENFVARVAGMTTPLPISGVDKY
jgi:hypothetical protein